MKYKHKKTLLTLSALLLLMLSLLIGCDQIQPPQDTNVLMDSADVTDASATEAAPDTDREAIASLELLGKDCVYLYKGYTLQLQTNAPDSYRNDLVWATVGDVVNVTNYGFVTAKHIGTTTVTVMLDGFSDTVTVIVLPDGAPIPDESQTDPPVGDQDDHETIPAETLPDETSPAETDTAEQGTTESEPPVTTEEPTEELTEEPTEELTEEPTEELTEELTEAPTEPETEPDTEYIPPTVIIEAVNSPAGYKPAGSYQEALDRTKNGELSGYPYVPDQAPNVSEYRPMEDGKYVKNNDPYYIDENTYVVVDAYGREVFRIYRGGAYITLEEVAAYVWAFGDIPANHSASKKTSPTSSIWGEYLRVNHTQFSGNTSKYPYEPALPRISGCGGDFTYYEMDIGTTGTDCDPSYSAVLYNNGTRITRGAARIVYARFDRNGNKIIDPDEKYVFYTYNHYNDFQEYLNYYGGWGEMFGNITGGGTISSKYDYNPTPYVPVALASIRVTRSVQGTEPRATILWYDFRRMSECLAWDKSRFAA
ncbi:MAG: Ig-like domain-containing protein [Clostridia bacterium]|nr:Ig-like domain-containing protein [Clostridia bacterium]